MTAIYLDYAASTPIDSEVLQALLAAYQDPRLHGNAHSAHFYGYLAMQAVDRAAAQLAELIGCDPDEIVWTSGATEANNLAIMGVMQAYQRSGRHLVMLASHHASALACAQQCEDLGYEVTLVKPHANGQCDFEALAAALRDDTLLVSMYHVNNETGVCLDIARAAAMAKRVGALVHVDAAQSATHIPINVRTMGVDLLSLSGHKMYGPKGVGALYLRQSPPKLRINPQVVGGDQQSGWRAGTLPTPLIVGMGMAAQRVQHCQADDVVHCQRLRAYLWELLSTIDDVVLNGDDQQHTPHIVNVQFAGVDNQQLIQALPGCAVSPGSACHGVSTEPSHVLTAMGLTRQQANASIRLSYGRMTTLEEIKHAVTALSSAVMQCRAIGQQRQLHIDR